MTIKAFLVGIVVLFTAQVTASAQPVPSQYDNQIEEASLTLPPNNLCVDAGRPWDHLMGTIFNSLVNQENVEFSLDKISFIRINPATKSRVLQCVYEVSGTMKARTVSGEMRSYSLFAEVSESQSTGASQITEFKIDRTRHNQEPGS